MDPEKDISQPVTPESTGYGTEEAPAPDESSAYEAPSLDQLGLGKPGEEPDKPEQPEGKDEATPQTDEPPLPSPTLKVKGQEYSEEQIAEALEVANNHKKWTRINQERSKEIAAERAEVERLRQEAQGRKPEAPTQPTLQQPQLTPEELQTKQWLDRNGYVSKETVEQFVQAKLDEVLTPLQKQTQQITQAQVSKELLGEVDSLRSKYSLSDDQLYDVVAYAEDNDLTGLPLEDVFMILNKPTIMSTLEERAKKQLAAQEARKKAASRVLPTRGKQSPQGNLLKYDPARDSKKSWSELTEDVKSAFS